MRLSRAPFLMSLNADIYLLPAFVDLALGALERYPRVGTLSGKMLRMRPDGAWTQRIDNAGLLFNRRRMPRHRGGGEQDRGQYQTPELVFGAMGAAAVYRRAMLDDVALGGSDGQYFDERFFTWYEDIDLDWRARRRGWDCLYLPEAVAYHVGDPQGHQPTPFGARYTIRNRWQMILANEPSRCIIRDAGWLLYEEWALFRHVASHGLLGAYARALRELIGLLPAVLRKRRAVQRRAQRTCLPDYPIPVEGNPT
jgi:GT2 family glycosyltransferase